MVLIGAAEERASGLPIHQSSASNPTRHLLPALYKASKNAKPLHIHPEDDI
jgi:hypothetical protein